MVEMSRNPEDTPNIPGPYIPASETESSPLKQSLLHKSKNRFLGFFCDADPLDQPGSLKTIVVVLFVTTAVVTLALLTQVYYGDFQVEPHGSVTSDNGDCSSIGLDILKNGGNAVDAAIACMLCLGVVNFHVTGLGGGGYIMVYNHRKKEMLDIIDFREIVPESYGSKDLATNIDGLMVGVPGMLLGLFEAHQAHGKLPWADLFMPSVHLARNGFTVPDSILKTLPLLNTNSNTNSKLVKLLNSIPSKGNITMKPLAKTLEDIAIKGPQVFYNGSIAGDIVYAVKVANGNMTVEDVAKYSVSRSKLFQTRFGDFDVLVPDSSSGGALLVNALDAIQVLDLNLRQDNPSDVVFKLSDILHDAYVAYLEKVDAEPSVIQPPVSAASQVSVMDKDEIYVSLIGGLNTWLGSQLLTDAGFILNNAIANGGINIERRPVSTVTPAILFQPDNICGRRITLGGDAIATAQILTEMVVLNRNTSDGVEYPRFMVDTLPRHIKLEEFHSPAFGEDTLKKLEELQIKLELNPGPYNSVNVIEKRSDLMSPVADSRGGGVPSLFR